MEAIITKIQKFSLNDGPGIRTTVFFKGCPLKCLWCHNPETQNISKDHYYDKNKCTHCLNCEVICKDINIKNNIIFSKNCIYCNKCVDICVNDCREIIGEKISTKDLLKEILKDEDFYKESNGGVTISGGEPLYQSEVLLEILKDLKDKKIHTCVDTCGFCEFEDFRKISKYVDLFLYDLKVIDSSKHQKYTLKTNEKILDNLYRLSKVTKNIIIRVPLIKGVNDDFDNNDQILEIMKKLNLKEIHFLNYHNYGNYKYDNLGINNRHCFERVEDNIITKIKNIFNNANIKVFVR